MGKGSRNRELRISDNQTTQNPIKLSKKQLVKQQEKKEKIKKYVTMIASLAIVVGLVVATVVATLNRAPKLESTISGVSEKYEINNGMMAYLMYSQYQQYIQENYYYLSYIGLDPSKSLKSQKMYDGTSWYNFFMEMAKTQVDELVALASEAKENGIELDEDEKKEIKDTVSSIKASAKANNYPTVDKFLAYNYVPGVTISAVESCLELQYLASKYYEVLFESDDYKFTEEQIAEYLEKNPDKFYKFDYLSYTFSAEYKSDATEAEIKAALEEAKDKANQLLEKITDEKSFRDAINELEKKKAEANKKDAETTAETGSSGEDKKEEKDYSENFFTEGGAYKKDDAFSKWAFEEGRASGDKKIIDVLDSKEKTTGYTVYFIIKPAYKDDYLTKNVVHILYSTATNGSKEAAKKAAEAILEEFKKGDATVEDFKELAKKYTEDEGSKEDGGLYEDVKKDVMVETFNDWIYDENRKEGDTGVVESTYGAHAMYFVGNGREAWKVDSENYLKSEKYDEDIKELIEKHKVTYDLEKLALIP